MSAGQDPGAASGRAVAVTEVELAAYCDGQLDEAEAARVETAMLGDPALRAEMGRLLAERRALAEAVGAGRATETEDPAITALAGRLAGRLERRRRRALATRGGAAAAALVLIAAAGWVGHALVTGTPMFDRPGAEDAAGGIPGFVANAAGAHAVFADDLVHPVEFRAADEAVMRRWFAAHVGDGAMIPDLGSVGFDLVGGRLLGDAHGAMAQLLYENARGDRVSLIFGRRPVPGGKEIKLVHVGKRFASYWRDGDLSWAVVENSPGADVSAVSSQVAELIRAARN